MTHFIYKHPGLPFVECRRSTDSGRHYRPHMHKTFGIGAADQGEVTYRVEEKQLKLKPGRLALINPETLHSCNPVDSGKRSYYMLHLDADWCLGLQQSLWRLDAFHPVKTVLLEDGAVYGQYVGTMEILMGGRDLLEKEQALVELVENIFLQACEPAAANHAPCVKIEHLKRHLSSHLDTDITMRQLAEALDANPYTLLRQFKAATGITPHAYRLNCRIDLARKLLQKGLELSQVALECGFFDQSHFHRHFKAMTAVTPKEYQVNFIQ